MTDILYTDSNRPAQLTELSKYLPFAQLCAMHTDDTWTGESCDEEPNYILPIANMKTIYMENV